MEKETKPNKKYDIGETVYIENVEFETTGIKRTYTRGKVVAFRWYKKFLFYGGQWKYLVDIDKTILKVEEDDLWGDDGEDIYKSYLNYNNGDKNE